MGRHEKVILLGHIISPFRCWKSGAIMIGEGLVRDMGPADEVLAQVGRAENCRIVDMSGYYIIPGMIDLHIHGAAGKDFMNGSVEDIARISASVLRGGTTAVLATSRTASPLDVDQALQAVDAFLGRTRNKDDYSGARILGVHIEGPYISAERAGGQPRSWIRPPDVDELAAWCTKFPGLIKMVTYAPECDVDGRFGQYLAEHGIIQALGHSNISHQEALMAFASGVKHITHAFNALPPIHHRKPGPIVEALLNPDVTIELIADGTHIHPAVLRLAYMVKGAEGIALVTDSTASGLPEGNHQIAGRSLMVKDGAARLADGTLAGSTLKLNQALRVCEEEAGIPLTAAVQMATYTPAKALGIADHYGQIRAGHIADLTVLRPDFSVAMVVLAGEIIAV